MNIIEITIYHEDGEVVYKEEFKNYDKAANAVEEFIQTKFSTNKNYKDALLNLLSYEVYLKAMYNNGVIAPCIIAGNCITYMKTRLLKKTL